MPLATAGKRLLRQSFGVLSIRECWEFFWKVSYPRSSSSVSCCSSFKRTRGFALCRPAPHRLSARPSCRVKLSAVVLAGGVRCCSDGRILHAASCQPPHSCADAQQTPGQWHLLQRSSLTSYLCLLPKARAGSCSSSAEWKQK